MTLRSLYVLISSALVLQCGGPELPSITMQQMGSSWDPFLDTLQARTIQFFLQTTDSLTGMALDRYPTPSPASIAAVGFALSTYPIAAERAILTRAQAARRTFHTLKHFYSLRQDSVPQGAAGYHGLFYHFLKLSDGSREWNCELSTIDTGLLMAGVLFVQSYFDHPDEQEEQIRALADSLYRRVDWTWTSEGREGVALGWVPDRGFDPDSWYGYNEAMIMYIIAFGSPTHPASPKGWDYWTSRYVWAKYGGLDLVNFGPLFGHQYSHCWIDFRDIKDRYMREKGIDYFENSRRATYTQQAYARQNPGQWRDYSDSIWGLTACDGPGDTSFVLDGKERQFHGYSARGVSVDWVLDDGTIAPTATASSIPFAPEICVPAVKALARKYGDQLLRPLGFADAFNPSFVTQRTPNGWFDKDYLGIDQGPIVIMIENYRNGLVWKTMRKNPYVVEGLKKAGFEGGWLK
jgi:hypothetical protein